MFNRKTLSPSLFILILVLQCLELRAQPEKPQFVNAAARFSIDIPGEPDRKEKNLTFGKYELNGEAFVWKNDAGDFTEVQQFAVYGPQFKLTLLDKKTVVNNLRDAFLDALKGAGTMTSHAPFAYQGLSGVELNAVGNGRLLTRIFVHGSRAYVVSVRRGTFEDVRKGMQTFKILSKNEYIAALIAENTPGSLPQDKNESSRSEAKHEWLKGDVSSVITYVQETPNGPRNPLAEAYYDRRGVLLKEITYLAGYPTDISVWGWLDGKRVVSTGHIEYGPSEGPNEDIVRTITGTALGTPDEAPGPKRDERYSYSFIHTYSDAGELTETKMLQNNARLWMVTRFIYRSGRRETFRYDEENKLNSRTVEILDGTGNVIEEQEYDYRNRLEEAVVYAYEFDEVGNWITRKEFKKVRGRATPSPKSITYRKTTYH